MTHDRLAHHFGELPATFIELASSLGGDLPTGMTLEAALSVIDERLSWQEDQRMITKILDDKIGASRISPPALGRPITVIGDAPNFTIDATDPNDILYWSEDGSYTGWVVLSVIETTRLRIHTIGSGMVDTQLGIWGPMDDPPGTSDMPWHFADDNLASPDSFRSSIHDRGVDLYLPDVIIEQGTHRDLGDRFSYDLFHCGIEIGPGTYWIAVWPYEGGWDTSEGDVRITFEHVERSLGSFSINADVIINAIIGHILTADATLRKVYESSLTAAAVMLAVASQSFVADATVKRTTSASFSSDAVRLGYFNGSLDADAVFLATAGSSFMVDALMSSTVQAIILVDAYLATQSARLDARWDNFWHRGQSWYGFGMDG